MPKLRRAWIAAVLLAATSSWAQVCPQPATEGLDDAGRKLLRASISKDAAVEFGKAGDADALERIVALGDPELVPRFSEGLQRANVAVLPEPVEALVIRHFDHPVMGAALRNLHPAYRTRALFDLHLGRIGTAPAGDPSFLQILRTDQPGIEDDLIAVAGKFPLAARQVPPVTKFLAVRRHPAAIPGLLAALEATLAGPDAGAYSMAVHWLLRYPSVDLWVQTQAAVDELRAQGRISAAGHAAAHRLLDPVMKDPQAALTRQREVGARETVQARAGQFPPFFPQWQSILPRPNPNSEARNLAQCLGRERDVEGLRIILENRNADLLKAYESGVRNTSVGAQPPRKMPAAIEALLVEYYDDPVIGGELRVLATTDRHQTRALFDLLLGEWRSGKQRPSIYPIGDSVLRTDAPGAEGALVEWLESPHPPRGESLRSIIGFLAGKRYEPAVPVLARMELAADLDSLWAALRALIDLRTPAAVEGVLERLARLREATSPKAAEIRKNVLLHLVQKPGTLPLSYKRFVAAEPEAARKSAPAWLAQRKDLDAAEDTLAMLEASPYSADLVRSLIASDSPAVWRRAHAVLQRKHEAGRISRGEYDLLNAQLEPRMADPAIHLAERERQARYAEFEARQGAIFQERNKWAGLRSSDPATWFQHARRLAGERAALARAYGHLPKQPLGGVPADVARDMAELARFARYQLGRPGEALQLYEEAERWGYTAAAFDAADIRHHQLGDRAGAIAAYRRVLEQGKDFKTGDAGVDRAAQRWLHAQIAWLGEGRRFAGPVDDDDLAAGTQALRFGFGSGIESMRAVQAAFDRRDPSRVDRAALARAIAALETSNIVFLASLSYLQYLPDADSILAFVERQDPAGHASAVFFTLVENPGGHKQEAARNFPELGDNASHPLREAARRFLGERQITYTPVSRRGG